VTDHNHTTRNQARRADSLHPGWLAAWLCLLVSLFLVPALLLAASQRESRRLEKISWEALLDASKTDPGLLPDIDVPTDKARRVTIGFYMESMREVSLHDSKWSGVMDVWCRWKDDPEMPGGADFNPFDHLIAVSGMITDRKPLEEIHEGDEHFVMQRLTIEYNKCFPIKNFPLDRHLLLAAFENSDHKRQDLVFVVDKDASDVSRRVSVAGYRLVSFHTLETYHSYQTSRGRPGIPATERGTWSQARFAIIVDRFGWGLFVKMFQTLFVAVAVALLACFIKPIHVDPRFGLGVGALFAAAANSYLTVTYVPDTNEFALADVINLFGIGTILVSLTESTISLWIYETLDNPALSRRLDRASFWAMLAAFVVSIALIVAGAVSHS
jgi:hypothetical protein